MATTTSSNISPNGTLLRAGSAGSLTTAAGTWTFGTATGTGGHNIMLNGKSAGGGSGVMLEVASQGQLYADSSSGAWHKWVNGSWSAVANPNVVSVGSTATLTVAAGSAAKPIKIAAPTDSVYSAARLKVTATGLPTDGSIWLSDGKTAVTKGEALTVAQLTGLEFKPKQGLASGSSNFTYTVSDPSGTSKSASVKLAIGSATGGTSGGNPSSPPAGYSASQLVGEDKFMTSSLDASKWNPWLGQNGGRWAGGSKALPSPYSSETLSVSPYNAEYYDPSHLSVGNGLKITASPSTKFSGYKWASGFVSSTSHEAMILPATGGYVQITAKLPDCSNGAWPCFWFLGEGGNSNQNVDWEFGYRKSPNSEMALGINDKSVAAPIASVDLSQGYHTYGTKYVPGKSFTFYLDNKQIASAPTTDTGAFEVTIGLQMATSAASGWHTVSDPTKHAGPYTLSVSDVRVYHS
jgi:hypothetical protein